MELKCPCCGHSEFTDFELKLLEAIIRNGPISRNDLSFLFKMNTNTISVHIKNIRDTIRVHDLDFRLINVENRQYKVIPE